MRPACAWDQTEIVLKASIEDRDQPLAAGWVQAYIGAMGCFPRLHVLADSLSTRSEAELRSLRRRIPPGPVDLNGRERERKHCNVFR